MRSSSCFCSATLSPGLEGQSMLFSVATQAPRNSRCTAGGTRFVGTYAAGTETAHTSIANARIDLEPTHLGSSDPRRPEIIETCRMLELPSPECISCGSGAPWSANSDFSGRSTACIFCRCRTDTDHCAQPLARRVWAWL